MKYKVKYQTEAYYNVIVDAENKPDAAKKSIKELKDNWKNAKVELTGNIDIDPESITRIFN